MHAVFAVALILIAGGFLFHGVAKARRRGSARRGRIRQGRARALAGQRSACPRRDDTAKTIWTQAHATNWLEQMRHHRENGTSPPPGKTIRAARATGRGVRKLRGAIWPAPKAQGAGGTSPPPAPAAVTLKPPAPPAPASPGTNGTSNGRQPTMASTTSSGSAEKLIEGVNQVHNSERRAASSPSTAPSRPPTKARSGSPRWRRCSRARRRGALRPGDHRAAGQGRHAVAGRRAGARRVRRQPDDAGQHDRLAIYGRLAAAGPAPRRAV